MRVLRRGVVTVLRNLTPNPFPSGKGNQTLLCDFLFRDDALKRPQEMLVVLALV